VFLCVIVIGIPNLIPAYPLAHHDAKTKYLTLYEGLLGTLAITNVLMLYQVFKSIGESNHSLDKVASDYLLARRELQAFFIILTTLVSSGTLQTAGLRRAYMAYGGMDFPSDYVVGYGLCFTALLALTFGPTHFFALRVGKSLRDRFLPLPAEADGLSDWSAKQKLFDEAFQLDVSTTDIIRHGAFVLSPLATSLLSMLFGGK